MEIVVRGRNVEVPEHYRQHVEDKVGQLERFDGKLKMLRMDVELFHEKNPRQSAHCQRVEITLARQGPGRPGRGRRRRLLRRPRPRRAPSSRTGCAARPTAAACTTAGGPRPACG